MEERPARKALRLKGWDYGEKGVYFLTFCVSRMRCVLSTVRRGDLYGRPPLTLTPIGKCVSQAIEEVLSPPGIRLEHFAVMPNHVHLLLTLEQASPHAIARAVGAVKSRSIFLAARQGLDVKGLWQRGYHDHIVRDEKDFLGIWTYIENNPLKWELDRYYTAPADNNGKLRK